MIFLRQQGAKFRKSSEVSLDKEFTSRKTTEVPEFSEDVLRSPLNRESPMNTRVRLSVTTLESRETPSGPTPIDPIGDTSPTGNPAPPYTDNTTPGDPAPVGYPGG